MVKPVDGKTTADNRLLSTNSMLQLPQPIDPTPLLQENLRQRLALMQQPTALSQIAPAIGQAVSQIGTAGIGAYQHAQQQKTLLAARQAAADYLSMTPQERQDPANADRVRTGIMGSLALGITPPQQQKSLEQILAEAKAREMGTNAGKPTKSLDEIKAEAAARAQGTASAKPDQSAAAKEKQAQGTAKMWQQQMNLIIPTIARRGSPLGIAAVNNQRKDRLLEIAQNPNPTPQEVRLMETDLAGVMQGGSPQEDTLRATHYGSIYQDWANLKGKVTGTPQDAQSPEIVAQLKKIALGVGSVDNKVITDNLHMIEKYPSMRYLIKKDPQGWDDFKQTLMSTLTQVPSDQAAPNSEALLDKYGAP